MIDDPNLGQPTSVGGDPEMRGCKLLLREMDHRYKNDLQLVVSLLRLQSQRSKIPEVREALVDAVERVSIVARARAATYQHSGASLEEILEQVCDALRAQAEPNSISVYFEAARNTVSCDSIHNTNVAMVVNELATNAIKHAFPDGKAGHIRVLVEQNTNDSVSVTVDDDGLPFPELERESGGLGMKLVKALMASIGGELTMPVLGTKLFRLRVPVATA